MSRMGKQDRSAGTAGRSTYQSVAAGDKAAATVADLTG